MVASCLVVFDLILERIEISTSGFRILLDKCVDYNIHPISNLGQIDTLAYMHFTKVALLSEHPLILIVKKSVKR